MKSYTVHEPPHPVASDVARADRMEFVREGFSWLALLFPVIWMLYYRMWITLGLFILAVLIVQGLGHVVGMSEEGSGIVSLFLNIAFAFEANNLRRWTLDRAGYQYLGTVSGDSYDECELKFFTHWLKAENASTSLTRLAAETFSGAAPSGQRFR